MSSRPLKAVERLEFRAARALAALPPRAQLRLSGGRPIVIDGQTLDPEVQLTLALLERRGGLPFERLSAHQARKLTDRQALVFAGPAEPVAAVTDLTVDGGEQPLPARHYRPADSGGPHPLLVFYHGGGWVIGNIETHDRACRVICRHAGVHVLSIDYRLAPEHPFPAAVEDARAAFEWAREHAAELGADPARVGVGGDSAGGNLAAVVSQLVRDRPPAFQLLIYPGTDATVIRRSRELFGERLFLTSAQMDWFAGHYFGEADRSDPRASPLLADDLSELPPALVVTAAFDPLRDEGEAYADALRAAGNEVLLRRFPGLVHGFISQTGVSRVSRDALIEIAGATRVLAAGVVPSRAPLA